MTGTVYGGPIVDTHVHFWDPVRHYYPRLSDKPYTNFRYGSFEPIKRPYLPDEYLVGARPQNITKVVHMEATFDPADPRGQTVFLTELAERFGVPTVIVPRVELERADAADELRKEAEWPRVRGIRQIRSGAASWEEAIGGVPSPLSDPDWLRGYELLERFGLHFELQIAPWHFGDAARLAGSFPRTKIALNHAGLPADRSPDGLARWADALACVAECPNVHVKISGIGQKDHPWTVDGNRPVVEEAIRIFGPERVMFASNFPVDSLRGTFDEIWDGFKTITAAFEPAVQRRMFWENAHSFYRIEGVEHG